LKKMTSLSFFQLGVLRQGRRGLITAFGIGAAKLYLKPWKQRHTSILAVCRLVCYSLPPSGGAAASMPPQARGKERMGRKTPEERYRESIRKQQQTLEEFAAREIEWAGDLLLWYKARKAEIPDDEYRAAVFFKNREYLRKPGSLTTLYLMFRRCMEELPEPEKETAFDLLAYRFKLYAAALEKGGY
jgi:hypothetical protein